MEDLGGTTQFGVAYNFLIGPIKLGFDYNSVIEWRRDLIPLNFKNLDLQHNDEYTKKTKKIQKNKNTIKINYLSSFLNQKPNVYYKQEDSVLCWIVCFAFLDSV